MKVAFAVSFGLFACGCARSPGDDVSNRASKVVAVQKTRETKPKIARAPKTHVAPKTQVAPKTKALTFADHIAQRESRAAARKKVAVDPRWEFSPREALQSLGSVSLFYAVAPTDTGAHDLGNVNAERPHHFGLTVWEVKTKDEQASLRVACLRLVSSAEDAAPAVPPTAWSYKLGSPIHDKDRILGKQNFRVCGKGVPLTNYLPFGQCNWPNHECWQAVFVTGGWAVYLTSSYDVGNNANAAAIDIVRAADLITDSLRSAQVSLDRPEFKFDKFREIHWGNQEATFVFSLDPARGKEICANLWNRVPREFSSTGIKGYGTRIIQVGGEGQFQCEVTTSNHHMRTEAFQLDWADEFGIGGSILHSLMPASD